MIWYMMYDVWYMIYDNVLYCMYACISYIPPPICAQVESKVPEGSAFTQLYEMALQGMVT